MSMDTVLTSLGLLLIATALTLMWSGPKTWLVAVAQGFGVQALIGAAASAIQTGWFMENSSDLSLAERVITAVQGLPFNAAGWTARAIFETTTGDTHEGAMGNLHDYLPIAAIQMGVVAVVMGWRRLDEEQLTDPFRILVWIAVVANTACNIQWPWWGQ
jgi:hypothetical protein